MGATRVGHHEFVEGHGWMSSGVIETIKQNGIGIIEHNSDWNYQAKQG